MKSFDHNYPFDPSYGYSLADLLAVVAPTPPEDFQAYWQHRYQQAIAFNPSFKLTPCGSYSGFLIYDLTYQSTNNFTINGWLTVPEHGLVNQAIIVGHGYGGREQPDYQFDIPNTAFLFPCFRGLGRSRCAGVSEQPNYHVLHGINNRDDYILGGCVEDLWLAVSVLEKLYPQVIGGIGYMGISFGGGIGALALPFEPRIQRGHFNVPTFGNQPLRLSLQTTGSAFAVKNYVEHSRHIFATLSYYDAAIAASFAKQSAHFALAVFDPVVAPPGQFAIYNAWAASKQLFVLDAGHFNYPNQSNQETQLLAQLRQFFKEMPH